MLTRSLDVFRMRRSLKHTLASVRRETPWVGPSQFCSEACERRHYIFAVAGTRRSCIARCSRVPSPSFAQDDGSRSLVRVRVGPDSERRGWVLWSQGGIRTCY